MEEVVGSLGVRELNTALERVLNPVRSGEPTVERFGWRFQMGDKVIQTENDYDKDVFNGDVGIIERIDAVEQQVAPRFDERLVKYDFGDLDEISLAYAITIPKSQGSEFPALVIPLSTQQHMLLRCNLNVPINKKIAVAVGTTIADRHGSSRRCRSRRRAGGSEVTLSKGVRLAGRIRA